MTAEELNQIFNNKYGLEKEWPKIYPVDAETYGNICQAFFTWAIESENEEIVWKDGNSTLIRLALGPNNGLMFKNVELILTVPKPSVYEDVKCPECGGKMISRKGQYGTFWGCAKYPDCRGTRDSEGRSKAERDAQKNKVREPGRWNVT